MAKQLAASSYNNRRYPTGAPSTNPAGRDRIPYQYLPSLGEIETILETLTANITIKTEDIPRRAITLPPAYTNISEIDVYTEMLKIDLRNGDLESDRPRTASLAKLCKALCIGKYTALDNMTPIQYKNWALCCPMNYESPEMPYGESSHLAVDNSTKFIIKSMHHRDTIKDASGKVGHMIIPELTHLNNCLCASDCLANNQESLHFLRICIPKYMRQIYIEASYLPDARNAVSVGKKYGNSHTVYYSPVSACGTVTPYMICRQPITEMTRRSPILRTSQYSHIDMANDANMLRAISACLARPEVRQYTKRFNESCRSEDTTPDTNQSYRFPRIARTTTNIDLLSLNPNYESLDQALANEPLAEPFSGPQACPYCPDILQITEPKDFLLHLFTNHEALTKTFFTCPACINICILDKDTYPAHYTEVHSGTSSLIMIFTETATNIRNQHALQLSLFVEIVLRLEKIYPITDLEENLHYASSIGGYSSNKTTLFQEIIEAQANLCSPEIQHELSLSMDTNFRQSEEIFILKRSSSPVSLHQKQTTYAEKTKDNTNKNTEPQTSRHSNDIKNEQTKEAKHTSTTLKKRRAEIISPERQMSMSPELRQSPPRRTSRRSPSSRRRSLTPDRKQKMTTRSLSRRPTNRSPSRSNWRNPSPQRREYQERIEDDFSISPSDSPIARRRANLYTTSPRKY
jgi:hypothetical protein